jgi:hypothetical protein
VDITIESISLTNCEINKLVLHTAVYTTNQKCATHFPQNRKCSFEASANFKSGKLEDSAYSKEETSQLETMLTAENTLPDQKHSFQIDFQTLISSSLGRDSKGYFTANAKRYTFCKINSNRRISLG